MRKPMVTRTIKLTTAKILCVNLNNNTTVEQTVQLPRTYKNEKAVLSKVESMLPDYLKAVKVLSSEVLTTRMGMTEDEFVELARCIDEDEEEDETEADTETAE